MELLAMLEYKRQEMSYLVEQMEDLKDEIEELEQRLVERELEKLNNPAACLNPIKFASYSCPNCHFYQACEFIHKSDYERLKHLPSTQAMKEDTK